jgi:hypothetical protein
VSTGAPPAARIRLIRRRTSGQSPGGANGGAPGDAGVADVDAPRAPRSGVACSTFNSTWSRFLRFAEGLESLARRDAAERAAGGRSGIFAESGDTARARVSWDGGGRRRRTERNGVVSPAFGRRRATRRERGKRRTALETAEPREDGDTMRAVCDSPRHARAIIRASGGAWRCADVRGRWQASQGTLVPIPKLGPAPVQTPKP